DRPLHDPSRRRKRREVTTALCGIATCSPAEHNGHELVPHVFTHSQRWIMARRIGLAALGIICIVSLSLAAEPESGKTTISFKKFTLDTKFRSEGVCVGDF